MINLENIELEIINKILYLVAVIFFVYGIKKMRNPETARKGNFLSIIGMSIGIITILFSPVYQLNIFTLIIILSCLCFGSIIGYISSTKVKLTAMPELISLFNGFGGGCSMLIGFVEMYKVYLSQNFLMSGVVIGLSAIFIGSITLSGSFVAWGKLSGHFFKKLKIPFAKFVNVAILIGTLFLAYLVIDSQLNSVELLLLFTAISFLYGLTFVIPIGGGDMPVVISFLNSLSGIAACVSGLLYNNKFMIVGGVLVGSSGIILTVLMCKAMNRSFFNVILGDFGKSKNKAKSVDGEIKEISLSDLAVQLKYAQKVIVVPGYGLAVAQAQHLCHEIEKLLEENGVNFFYAIHPVAGRMPGHMNVLLAEAQVSYDKLLELEQANENFPTTDVVLVVGANDVVNPDAKDNSGSPIYGMPILEVKSAKKTIVLKRSMASGYAGIQNPLFFSDNTNMLFGDAKETLGNLKTEINSI